MTRPTIPDGALELKVALKGKALAAVKFLCCKGAEPRKVVQLIDRLQEWARIADQNLEMEKGRRRIETLHEWLKNHNIGESRWLKKSTQRLIQNLAEVDQLLIAEIRHDPKEIAQRVISGLTWYVYRSTGQPYHAKMAEILNQAALNLSSIGKWTPDALRMRLQREKKPKKEYHAAKQAIRGSVRRARRRPKAKKSR